MPRKRAERELLQMLETLRHENFYVTGTCVEESLGVYVSWVARKDSFSDNMPIRNEQGDVVLVFSGEEFPEPGIIQRLRGRGHNIDASRASYILHVYEDDSSFPASLNGRFHGLIADRTRQTVTLFNDRYGMHRLYYHESKDAFYFAAEAKAILALRPELRRMDSQGVGEFISCGAVLENRTLFNSIYALPPASDWSFRNGSLQKKGSYFSPREWEDQGKLDPESYYKELRNVYTRNLPRYFDGGERIAMSLTGGLDTRMIMAWHEASAGSFPCYTFGGMQRDCKDVTVARELARICNQPHRVIPIGADFLAGFPSYAERSIYLTDGCVDTGRSPDLYLNERAREIAPVRMTGNYGGEVLRRVRTFKPVEPLRGLFVPECMAHVHQTHATYSSVLSGNPVSFTVFKQGPWNHFGILALEESQLSLRTPFLDNDLVRTVFRAPESALNSNEDSLRLIADGKKELLRIPTDRGVAGRRGAVSSALYRKFLEFQFKAEYAYDMGMPQWIAKIDHAFSALHFEDHFLGRHKIFHFRSWYRNALAPYVREMLLDPRSLNRPYIERRRLEDLVRGHLRGDQNYTIEIHKVLSLELIHRLFIDHQPASGFGSSTRLARVAVTA